MKRSRTIATSLVVGSGLFFNTAPAAAGTGGMSPEAGKQGGVTAGEATAPTPGGVSAEGTSRKPSNLAAKIRYIKKNIQHGTRFNFLTLDPNNRNAHIQVTGDDGELMINPLAVLSADGSEIARYVSRKGENGIDVMPADEAKVTLYMGSRVMEEVTNPSDFLAPHTLRPTPDLGKGPFTLTAENGELFAAAP